MQTKALITGITGQDGRYLAELLCSKGYVVHGVSRRSPDELPAEFVDREDIVIHRQHADEQFWAELIGGVQPAEIYHLAADSFVPNSWDHPIENLEINTGTTSRILEAMRHEQPTAKLVNACSREIFGNVHGESANEETPMAPITPYGIHKAAARWLVHAYRDRYGLFATNAILFNHESPRRGRQFVTRKITSHVAEIKFGLKHELKLGNLDACRDWGYAGDFVIAMWQMLQHESPEDFVLGTGQLYSIRQFVEMAFAAAGLQWDQFVRCTEEFNRAQDAGAIRADIGKAQRLLNWQPSRRP